MNRAFKNINLLHKALNASWLRNEAISNNIANVNTPNYKKQKVEFEELLNQSISNISIQPKLTNSKHMSINPSFNNKALSYRDTNTKVRKDGNNVNIDIEMANLAKNTIYYNTLSQRLSSQFNKLKTVIKDGR